MILLYAENRRIGKTAAAQGQDCRARESGRGMNRNGLFTYIRPATLGPRQAPLFRTIMKRAAVRGAHQTT